MAALAAIRREQGEELIRALSSNLAFSLFFSPAAQWSREVVFSISSGSQQSPTKRVFEHTLVLGGNKNEKLDALMSYTRAVPIQRVCGYFLDIRISFSWFSSRLLLSRAISHHLLFPSAKTLVVVHAHLLVTRNQLHSFFLFIFLTLVSYIYLYIFLASFLSRS